MWNDPIVEETREIRDKIAARFNYDVWALGEYFKSKRSSEALALISKAVSAEITPKRNRHNLLGMNKVKRTEVAL